MSLAHRFISPSATEPFYELFNKPLERREISFVLLNTPAYFCPFFIALSLLMEKSETGQFFGVSNVRFEFLTVESHIYGPSVSQTDTTRPFLNYCELLSKFTQW